MSIMCRYGWLLVNRGHVMVDAVGVSASEGGFEVYYELLAEAAKGISGVISELSKLGIDETGEVGRGFSLLDLDEEGLGVPDLAGAFSAFTGRWSWGVRTLVQDGNQFAVRLGLSAGVYYNTEQYLTGVAKVVVNAAAGDPHRSAQQVQNESYGQIFSAWKPSGVTSQQLRQMSEINSAEWKDIKNGPWWMQTAKTTGSHL
jgi:hypothetical protein